MESKRQRADQRKAYLDAMSLEHTREEGAEIGIEGVETERVFDHMRESVLGEHRNVPIVCTV